MPEATTTPTRPLIALAIPAFLALAGCAIPVSPDAAPVADCADWNSIGFFDIATVDEIAGCLQRGAAINVRDQILGAHLCTSPPGPVIPQYWPRCLTLGRT